MAELYLRGWLRGANTLLMDSDHPLMYESDCDVCTQLKKAYLAAIRYLIAWFCSVLLIKINSLCCTVAHRLWTCCTVTGFNCTVYHTSRFMCPYNWIAPPGVWWIKGHLNVVHWEDEQDNILVIGPLFILSVQNYKASCAVERRFVMHDAGCQEILYFIAI